EPFTAEPFTAQPVTPQPVTPQPVTAEPVVLEPVLVAAPAAGPSAAAWPEAVRAPGRAGAEAGGARPRTRRAAAEDAQWAMLAYLTVPVFGIVVSLAIYLLSLRGSRWVRAHAAQAINVWLTGVLYDFSALIVGGLLMLDSAAVALAVVVPLVAALWLTTLGYLIRAGRLASQGRDYAFPRWLCTQLIR
ncbi:MAG TPA: DUF4870 domain-containing protein, partial [Streptosporangiaceae bacterium]|nr:DUF4870 domain-containing protein [Streptosporangiaceae bacterium]